MVPTRVSCHTSSMGMSHHSGRFVIQSNRFMYLRESFKAIANEHEIDLTKYDEAMSDVDAHLW